MDKQEQGHDQSKFKKVEMPLILGEDPESWLFKAERYFDVYKRMDLEKMTVANLSFDGIALTWYRWTDNRQKFTNWPDSLKT